MYKAVLVGTRLLGGRGEKDILHCYDSFFFFFFLQFLMIGPVTPLHRGSFLNTKLCAEARALMRTRLPGGRGERDTAHRSIATRV